MRHLVSAARAVCGRMWILTGGGRRDAYWIPRDYCAVRAHGVVCRRRQNPARSASGWSGPRNCRPPIEVLPDAGRVRVCWGSGTRAWNLVAANRNRRGNRSRPLFRGSHRVPSACRRCQRHWVCLIHIGACRSSARPSRPDNLSRGFRTKIATPPFPWWRNVAPGPTGAQGAGRGTRLERGPMGCPAGLATILVLLAGAYGRWFVLPTQGNVELTQTQGFGRALLGQRLLGEQGGHAVRTFLALGWVE